MVESQANTNTMRSNVDGYGFERGEDFDHNTYEEFMAKYISILARRASKWEVLVQNKTSLVKSRKVKRFCRKGIPNGHRAMVWMCVSGADEKMKRNPDTYKKLLLSQQDQSLMDTIDLDLHRTFPENIYFATSDGLRKPLRNVLGAVAHKNHDQGYCQGLNFIVGLLLLLIKDEEKVFWLMDTLINDLLPDYYNPDMKAVKADQELLGEIIRWKDPEVYAHIEKHSVSWCLIGIKWFICLFADVLPVETVYRIWDCLFYEGAKILYRVSAMLVIQNRDKLLACKSFTEITDVFKEIVNNPNIVDCHTFLQKCFNELGSFPIARLKKIQEECSERL
ncbi:growth hormone-regulated TBC protein 1-A-like isoform X1 [Mytilus galloprovincialis]|uniref:growth hormone-regulated TBC protein 1-A-like isoform X1 n=1 Tax=Mytilus galloprovincialis TaxID=29158 RepID=UPI003F7CCF4D